MPMEKAREPGSARLIFQAEPDQFSTWFFTRQSGMPNPCGHG